MSLTSNTWQQLVNYLEPIIAGSPIAKDQLRAETDLFHDLDFNPSTIAKLVDAWSHTFNIDISDFDIDYYYPFNALSKSGVLITALIAPFSRRARETLGGRQLTLGMLEEAMRRKKWLRE